MFSLHQSTQALNLNESFSVFGVCLCVQDTRIGMSVNALRKHCTDEEVNALAKILIKNWKRLLGKVFQN